MKRPDDQVLSRYLDGELECQRIIELAEQLADDCNSRDRLVELVGVQARLRSTGRSIIDEEIPAHLLATLRGGGQRRRLSSAGSTVRVLSMPLLRYVVVIALVMLGFFSGRAGGDRSTSALAFFPSIPVELQSVVNRTLEFEPSGATKDWQDLRLGVSARIEPVRTFRGPGGEFYRMYVLELIEGNTVQPYVGVARRAGNQKWQTRSLYLREGKDKI